MCDAGGARRGQPAEVPPPDALAGPLAALGHGVAKQRFVGDLSNLQGEELGQVFRSADESRRSSMSSPFLSRWPVHLPTMPGAIRGVTNRSGHAA